MAYASGPDDPIVPPADPTRRARRFRALAIVGLVLGVSAVALNAAVPSLKLNFRKEAVEPRASILTIPTRIGPYLAISDVRMPAEIEEELGTTDYIQRTYIDLRYADDEVLQAYENAELKTDEIVSHLARNVRRNSQSGGVTLHVAYYTGSVDTVPHIPDRCMLGAGFDMVGRETLTLPVATEQTEATGGEIDVSFAAFQDNRGSVGSQKPVQRVAYFFHVNGDYEHDAITGVRKRLQNLFETHAYFAKIEVATLGLSGEAEETEAVEDLTEFLNHALPEVENILPDWNEVVAAE